MSNPFEIPVGDEQEPKCDDGIPCDDHDAAAHGCFDCPCYNLSDEDWMEVNARCLDAMVADCFADEDHLRSILLARMETFSYAERLETAGNREA